MIDPKLKTGRYNINWKETFFLFFFGKDQWFIDVIAWQEKENVISKNSIPKSNLNVILVTPEWKAADRELFFLT